MAETFLNVYEVTREYGGPEEGGWWYNARHPVTHLDVTGQPRKIIDQAKALLRRLYHHLIEGDIYSSRGGSNIEVVLESKAGTPTPRPHYE